MTVKSKMVWWKRQEQSEQSPPQGEKPAEGAQRWLERYNSHFDDDQSDELVYIHTNYRVNS